MAKASSVEKVKCPVSLGEFKDKAKPLTLKVGDQTLILTPKQFSTGSFGWGLSDKVTLMVGDVPVKVQCSINLTVVGSKPKE